MSGDAVGSRLGVVIVDDHEMVASAFRAAVEGRRDINVSGVASTLAAGIGLTQRTMPRVVVVDLHLPDGSPVDAFEQFLEASPGCSILVVTGWPSEKALFSVLDAGASGFIAKGQPIDELLDAIVRVSAGETVVAPTLLPALIGRSRRGDRGALSDRELEVLQLLADGASTRAVADRLALSPHTVRNHVGKLMLKLRVHSRLEAVSMGVRHGLISPGVPSR